MPQLISLGNELIRINTEKKQIEYSPNNGISWISRYSSSSVGEFVDLFEYGTELLACTSKGLYYSTNKGISWISRYSSNSVGEFISLHSNDKELLATTTLGLYYSTNKGVSWIKRN